MIELSFDGPVARLLLNRPEARNALAVRHWHMIAEALETVAASNAQLLVLSGAGGAFGAGADLTEFPPFQADEAARVRFREAMRLAMEPLAALPIATVAFIDGPCFGAGAALAMAADVRVATPAARFAITPAKMGIGYPQEDIARLVALVGPGAASRLLFTGQAIDASEALRIGLVEEVGDRDALDRLVDGVCACDGDSVRMLKRGIALARRGIAQDDEQDSRFDALLGSPLLAERLSQRRTTRTLPPSAG